MARTPYSYNQLIYLIGNDYAWRRKELKLIKDQIPSKSSPKQNAALRFSVPILYAHWEGFVKKSCELYLEFVAKKYLKHNELKPQFVALSLSKKLGDLDIKHIEQKTKIVEFLISEIDKNSNMQTKNVIQTKSNLRYSVLEEILFIIGIDESKFSHKRSLINDLVDARNHIAHGDYLRVEYDAYHLMHDDVQILMEQLKTEIENTATLEEYKLKKASA